MSEQVQKDEDDPACGFHKEPVVKYEFETEDQIKLEVQELEEDTKEIFEEQREDIKNLVVRSLRGQLFRKMEAIREQPQNILRRFDGYIINDSNNKNG